MVNLSGRYAATRKLNPSDAKSESRIDQKHVWPFTKRASARVMCLDDFRATCIVGNARRDRYKRLLPVLCET